MDHKTRLKCQKYCTLFGIFLLYMPSGVPWYWGNIAVYSSSFFRNYLKVTSVENLTLTISLYAIGEALGVFLSSVISNKIGHRLTQILAVFFFDVSVFMGFYLCQVSPIGLAVTMGALTGLASGIVYAEVLNSVVEWFSDHVGFYTALVTTGINVGPIIINEIATMYINPDNLAPDHIVGKMKYFSQTEILVKVPWLFVLIGCLNVVLHIVGLILIQDKRQTISSTATDVESINHEQTSFSSSEESSSLPPESVTTNEQPLSIYDFNPKDMMKTFAFYALWLSTFGGEFANIVLLNFSKTFGQLWIQDDHFLTDVGLGITIGAILCRFMWGVLIDKAGMKFSLLFFSAAVTILNSFWYFTPQGGKWVFFFYTSVMSCVDIGVYVLSSVCTLKMFGRSHFNVNLSIVMSAFLVLNFIAPPVQKFILFSYGWFSLFFTVGCLNAIGMFVAFVGFPRS